MKYFKNAHDEIYAYEDADLEHDEQVKRRISELEHEKAKTENAEEGNHYNATISQLRSTIRVSDSLIPITEKEMQDLTAPSNEVIEIQFLKSEHAWVKSELDAVTVELMYHWTSDHRASHTEQAWKDYAIALRNYTSTDADGNPIMTGESRPSIDSYL